ncbi:MAG: RNA polymerase factor sigma-54 [Rikenellaceae bacterium]
MANLSQTLSQRLNIKLSPQQIQGIKLLELPTTQLEARIKEEIEENPVLEESPSQNEEGESRDSTIEEYLRAEEGASSFKLRTNNYSKDDKEHRPTLSGGKSLAESLAEQLSFYDLSPKEQSIAQFIIGTLDDDGYLRRDNISLLDDLAFTQGIEVEEPQLEEVISIIQQLEPLGVGARDLSECLLLQLEQMPHPNSTTRYAIRILRDFFGEFLKKHYDRICQRMAIDQDSLREAIDLIMSLNPKPSNGYSDESVESAPVIIPDFLLDYNSVDDIFDLQLSTRGVPQLKISSTYARMAEETLQKEARSESEKEALNFIKGKIESARWFIAAIKQRQLTLTRTMSVILDFQRDYFKEGDPSCLRPMILKDIAELTGFDISTISRVVNSKYIQTHFGIFLLKYFFSEGIATDSGEEVSTIEIKRILREFVDSEDSLHPLTDENLMIMLQDRGFRIARRTVAKYREMMDIPVARLRRKI